MSSNHEAMPKRIFAGYFGGGRFWGEVTDITHPDNVRYVREDMAALSQQAVSEREIAEEIHDAYMLGYGALTPWDCADNTARALLEKFNITKK